MYKRSIFPTWCLQLSKTKPNAKTVLMRLAFPINAHQNANQKPIGSAPAYQAQFHPVLFTGPSTLIIRGSGSETRCSQCGVGMYVHVRLTCSTLHTFFLFSSFFLVTVVMVACATGFDYPDAFPWKPSPHTLALVHFSCVCVCNSKTTTYL